MRYLYTTTQALDKRALSKYLLSDELLMENAANALLSLIDKLTHKGSVVTIVCGSGDNGADGYALARKLQGSYITRIYEAKEPKSRLCKLQSERAQVAGCEWVKKLLPCDVLVDCLFGSGLAGELSAESIKLLEQMNTCARIKIACDVPSGLNLQGCVASYAFSADYTLSMGALKVALFSDMAKDIVGQVLVGDLGVSRELFEVQSPFYLLEESDMRLPHRTKQNCHKGTFGHIAVISGEKAGAAELSAMSGLRMGAGLVSVVSRDCALFSRDSALGEQCGSVADFVKGTNAKFANLPQNPQSSHSPTANPRILEEEKQAESENQTALESSSRAAQSGVAIHNANADSSLEAMDCHASTSALARNDGNNAASETAPNMSDSQTEVVANVQNMDSSNATNVSEQAKDSKDFNEKSNNANAANVANPQAEAKVDSSNAQNLNNSAQDSRILELQIGVFQGEQGDKTSGLSPQRAEEIHDFSPKAESTKKAQSTLPQQSELMYPHSIPKNANVLCLGMGLGSGFGCLLEPSFIGDRLCVLDADVFYEHSLLPLLESTSAHNLVLTPHPKEFHALLHLCGLFDGDIAEVARNRFELALCFTQAYKAPTLLLKGANPIIAHNGKLYINPLGTSALAKGGSGDVLSGVIASYLAQGFSPLDSAIYGSLAHAKAATKEKNTYALTPLRLIEHLGAL
ncbi:NAD(P)H-hydrate epimerase [Helicobacter canis]|uniref:Multifunctional fusion protein n=1 Tax=Helicobacter canis NCTC 12740 TaxID=1357399 RepID=V8CJP9_9HELI|nr:NAD(P)H-hydrate epimerase [Helicobacter canis]ETD27628.1 YjeF family domain-containing protein [Helicobacter canis NCTC 12740]